MRGGVWQVLLEQGYRDHLGWGTLGWGCCSVVATQRGPLPVCRQKLKVGDLANMLSADELLKHLQHWRHHSASTCKLSRRPRPGDLSTFREQEALTLDWPLLLWGALALWDWSGGGRGSLCAACSQRL